VPQWYSEPGVACASMVHRARGCVPQWYSEPGGACLNCTASPGVRVPQWYSEPGGACASPGVRASMVQRARGCVPQWYSYVPLLNSVFEFISLLTFHIIFQTKGVFISPDELLESTAIFLNEIWTLTFQK